MICFNELKINVDSKKANGNSERTANGAETIRMAKAAFADTEKGMLNKSVPRAKFEIVFVGRFISNS